VSASRSTVKSVRPIRVILDAQFSGEPQFHVPCKRRNVQGEDEMRQRLHGAVYAGRHGEQILLTD
jgi:hypothetical protein